MKIDDQTLNSSLTTKAIDVKICKLACKLIKCKTYAKQISKFFWRLLKVWTNNDFIVWLNMTEMQFVQDSCTLVYRHIFKNKVNSCYMYHPIHV